MMHIPILKFVAFVCLVALLTDNRVAQGQDKPSEVTVATVGNQQISLAQVENLMRVSLGDRKLEGDAKEVLAAASTRQLVNQLLVVEYLKDTKHGLSEDEVNLQIERLTGELAKTEQSLNEFLRERNQTIEGLRQQIRWQFGWAAYLKHHLTKENMSKFFDKHKQDFDGTQFRIAHIILAVAPDDDERIQKLDAASKKASQIKAELKSSEITWKQAVEKYSDSASKGNEGEVGWIERLKPMPEAFSKTVFKMSVGDVSEPIQTRFGVHLVRVLEIKAGEKRLAQVRKQVEKAATKFVFEWIVKEQATKTEVRYTGKAPYFDPQSGKLVRPGKNS